MVPTHNIVDETERHVTYHPSRLMGLSDMLNTVGNGRLVPEISIRVLSSRIFFSLSLQVANISCIVDLIFEISF